MKTKEFIRRVEELGYFINEYVGYYEIRDVDKNLIAAISETNFLQLSTNYSKWYELSDIDKKELFDLLVEYAKTPIEDREEEKKFYLRHRWIVNSAAGEGYLNWFLHDDIMRLSSTLQDSSAKTQFTLREIEEIKEKFDTDLKDFELVEVEDEKM